LISTLDSNPSGTSPESVECGIRAFGVIQAPPATISALRKNPAPAGDPATMITFLKYADDQTVVSLAAVLRAIHNSGLDQQTFTDWGVVAAPSFLGRETVAAAFKRFRRQGALGVSPLLIPYLSQHAVAGTISLPLRIHGPNLGVAGGKGSMVEALLTALTLQQDHHLPGVWVVFSQWEPEPIPKDKDAAREESMCRAVSLALLPADSRWQGLRLRFVPGQGAGATEPSADIAGLAQFLANHTDSNGPQTWNCPLSWNGHLELTSRPAILARAA